MKCYANYQAVHDMPEPSAPTRGRKLDSVGILTKLLDAPTRARFWQHVRRTPTCWLWTASTTGRLHHGQFHLGRFDGRLYNEYAHRVAWMLLRGPIPRGLQANHHCDVPTCVNPDHLYLGTQGDNVRDGIRRNRYPKYRAHRKMSAEQVVEARALRLRGWKLQPLADRFGVSKGQMSLICRGERRTHLAPAARRVGAS